MLSAPPLVRARLEDRLLHLPPGGVGLVVAPGGYGGTVLLHGVAARSSASPIWFTGPARAGGRARFWADVCSALSAAGLAVAQPPSVDEPESWAAFTADLRRALEDGPDVLLLLTDLGDDPRFDREVQRLVDVLTPNARLVIRARRTPHLDVSRQLAAGRLVLLDRWDLSLDLQEATEYVMELAPGLSDERRSALVAAAEGWIGALYAGLSGARGSADGDPATWLQGPGLALMFGRLLDGMPADETDLLVRCSVLDTLTPDACDRILGRSDSGRLLARLSQEQVLTHPAGASGLQYRCHGLLRSYLRRQLEARGQDAVAQSQRAVGLWLADQGDVDSAITHLLDSGAVDQAKALLDSHIGELLDSGRSSQVQQWYHKEPGLAGAERHRLVLGAAWSALLTGDVVAAHEHLCELEMAVPAASSQGAGTQGEYATWLRAEADYLRSRLHVWAGRTDQAQALLQRVQAAFGSDWDRTSPQSAALLSVRLALWSGQDGDARAALQAISERAGTNQYYRRVAIPSLRAALAAAEGRAHRARFLADDALEALSRSGGLGILDDADARLGRSRALADLGEARPALAEALDVQRRAEALSHCTYLALAICHRGLALAAAGEFDAADRAVEEARQVLRERAAGNGLLNAVQRSSVEVAVQAGDRGSARKRLAALPPGPSRDRLAVRVAALGGAFAEGEVTQLLRAVRPTFPRELVDARMLMAAATAESRPAEASAHIAAGAAIAFEHGMHRALVGRAQAVQVLAARLAEGGQAPAVAALVEAAQGRPDDASPLPPLSHGERALLEALASSRTQRDVADELGISMNTVKTRLRRLYTKLGVGDRDAALRRVGLGP